MWTCVAKPDRSSRNPKRISAGPSPLPTAAISPSGNPAVAPTPGSSKASDLSFFAFSVHPAERGEDTILKIHGGAIKQEWWLARRPARTPDMNYRNISNAAYSQPFQCAMPQSAEFAVQKMLSPDKRH